MTDPEKGKLEDLKLRCQTQFMKHQHAESNLSVLNLAEMSRGQLAALASLQVARDQEELGGTFKASVNEWKNADADQILGLAFYLGSDPVGIVLLKRFALSPSWVPDEAISLHGLKIGKEFQGRGLGREAFGLAIEAAKAYWPSARQLMLAVDAGNEPALSVYKGAGMRDSGPIYKGRIGYEHRLELVLKT